MNIQHKMTLIKWTIENHLLKMIGKTPIHCPTKPYEDLLRELKLDKYIDMVKKSYYGEN